MKLTLVRLIKNKEPVCVIPSHEGELLGLFWSIDEFTNPHECEVKDVEIESIGFGWLKPLEFEHDAWHINTANLTEQTDTEIGDLFESAEGWIKPDFQALAKMII